MPALVANCALQNTQTKQQQTKFYLRFSQNKIKTYNFTFLSNFCKKFYFFDVLILKCCAGRSGFGRRGTRRSQTARGWPRAARHQKFKKSGSCSKATSHEKQISTLDVQGLWHTWLLPTASILDKLRPAAAQNTFLILLHYNIDK